MNNCIGNLSICIKKGSRTLQTFIAWADNRFTLPLDLSAYDGAEFIAYDRRGGDILFTVNGTITDSTIDIIIPPSSTINLTIDNGFYDLKVMQSTDPELDWFIFEGSLRFLD